MKFSNALTTPKQKFFDNAEVSGLLNIFGYKGYSKKFDPEKFKPEKVVIATDADADGDHITFLLFTFFLLPSSNLSLSSLSFLSNSLSESSEKSYSTTGA